MNNSLSTSVERIPCSQVDVLGSMRKDRTTAETELKVTSSRLRMITHLVWNGFHKDYLLRGGYTSYAIHPLVQERVIEIGIPVDLGQIQKESVSFKFVEVIRDPGQFSPTPLENSDT